MQDPMSSAVSGGLLQRLLAKRGGMPQRRAPMGGGSPFLDASADALREPMMERSPVMPPKQRTMPPRGGLLSQILGR